MKVLRGIPASRGVAIGPVLRFQKVQLKFKRQRVEDPQAEWERFQSALRTAEQQLERVCAVAMEECGPDELAIFQAHMMMLEDPELMETIRRSILEEHVNAEAALSDAATVYVDLLEAVDDEYFRARAADVRDVTERVLRALLDVPESGLANLIVPSVILARDLTPSDTILMDKSLILGFCTAQGGATSHTAILARSLGLPAVVGMGPQVLEVRPGAQVLLDGGEGTLLVDPDPELISRYQVRQELYRRVVEEAREKAHEPAVTRDGHRVEVVANIGNVQDAELAHEAGAEGVGLLRTEFLFLERSDLPSEEEQYQAYRAILDVFGDRPVILRTLDIGGDKELPYLDLPTEANPFLGLRAIRLCLSHPKLFRIQLRSALRAGVDRNLKVMFPMVATIEEVRRAREIFEECQAELRASGEPYAQHVETGIMIEVPSAALMADQLAAEVDFFSIGTNDLSQYVLAADRTNAQVAPLASGFHPAVLRLVSNVIQAAHAHGKWVGLCGELAGEPLAIPILLGLGLDEFSMNAPAVPIAKQLLRSLSLEEAQDLAPQALDMETPEAVKALVREQVPEANLG
ncbi:MAG: phosphoenolpyruvate--protein phosphotransferase [Anaerolineae bacterium]